MKDLDWLKKEFNDLFNGKSILTVGKSVIDEILDQLDQPETLSQEWIDDNSVYASSDGVTEEYVHVDDLQNLLVPTLSEMEAVEITEEQVIEWLDNNDFYDHTTAETVLANAVDKGELGYYGTKYAVIKKPVIPKEVGERIEREINRYSLYQSLNYAYNYEGIGEDERRVDEWIIENTEEYAQAWFNWFTVEELEE